MTSQPVMRRWVIRVSGYDEQMPADSTRRSTVFMAATQQEAIEYGKGLFGVDAGQLQVEEV